MRTTKSSSRGQAGPLHLGDLYRAESGHVAGLLMRLGVPKDDLDDVTHEAFLRVLRFSSTFDASQPGRPWLLSIAYRAAIDHQRHVLSALEPPPPPATDPIHRLLAADLVAAGLRQLSPAARRVFELHELVGLSLVEVSRQLGLSLPTAYSRHRRARIAFVAALQKILLEGL